MEMTEGHLGIRLDNHDGKVGNESSIEMAGSQSKRMTMDGHEDMRKRRVTSREKYSPV